VRITKLVVASIVVALGFAMSAPFSLRAQAVSQGGGVGPVTLKLTLVISRFNGEKKVGNLPFQLMVIPGDGRDGDMTNLQTGANVPVPQTSFGENKQPQMSYSYRQFGTNISAAARAVAPRVAAPASARRRESRLCRMPDQ